MVEFNVKAWCVHTAMLSWIDHVMLHMSSAMGYKCKAQSDWWGAIRWRGASAIQGHLLNDVNNVPGGWRNPNTGIIHE